MGKRYLRGMVLVCAQAGQRYLLGMYTQGRQAGFPVLGIGLRDLRPAV